MEEFSGGLIWNTLTLGTFQVFFQAFACRPAPLVGTFNKFSDGGKLVLRPCDARGRAFT